MYLPVVPLLRLLLPHRHHHNHRQRSEELTGRNCRRPEPDSGWPAEAPVGSQQAEEVAGRCVRSCLAGLRTRSRILLLLRLLLPHRHHHHHRHHTVRRLEGGRRARSLHCARSSELIPLNERAHARLTRRRSQRAEHISQSHPPAAQPHRCRRCLPVSPARFLRAWKARAHIL